MAIYTVGTGKDFATIQAAIALCSEYGGDEVHVYPGSTGMTYTETLDIRPGGSWLLPLTLKPGVPGTQITLASTGAAWAIRGDANYRASGLTTQLVLEDVIFDGWSSASSGVLFLTGGVFARGGFILRRSKFVDCVGVKCITLLCNDTTWPTVVEDCEFINSGSVGSGSNGAIISDTFHATIKNCIFDLPTNVQALYGTADLVAHNVVYCRLNTGGNCTVFRGGAGNSTSGPPGYIANIIVNIGTGGLRAIDATDGTYVGRYGENIIYGAFDAYFGAGTDDGGNITGSDPLLTDPGAGDFTLQLASPAVRSTARNASVLETIDGETRSDPTDAGPYEAVLDTTPPTITGWTRASKSTVVLTFSEDLDETSAETSGNYTTSPTRSVTATLTDTNEVTLTLSPAVDSVVLAVADVEDLYGNAMASPWSRELGWYESETSGDVVYAVTSTGGPVDYLPGWDPMPSGVGSEATLERLVFVSLYSDARIANDETPPDGTGDRRGWWGDTYSDRPDNTGSRLWYLMGRAGTTAREIEDAVRAALSWMITDRLCSSITVVATIEGQRAGVTIDMGLTSGDRKQLAYPDLWSAYAP